MCDDVFPSFGSSSFEAIWCSDKGTAQEVPAGRLWGQLT
jgi:hypothetical protein